MTAIGQIRPMSAIRLKCDGCRKVFIPRSVGSDTVQRARLRAMRQGWLVGCVRPGSDERGDCDYCPECRYGTRVVFKRTDGKWCGSDCSFLKTTPLQDPPVPPRCTCYSVDLKLVRRESDNGCLRCERCIKWDCLTDVPCVERNRNA